MWNVRRTLEQAVFRPRKSHCRPWKADARRVQVVPVLRAGLVLLEQAATVLPSSETYHVGHIRDENTMQVAKPCHLPPAGSCPPCNLGVRDGSRPVLKNVQGNLYLLPRLPV